MTEVEAYLARVRGSMLGMDPEVREDILRELRSHLTEAVAANGGDAGRTLAELGPPARVGREYRQVYGYGRGFQALFAAIAFLLAIPSSPILQVTEEFPLPNLLALPFLVALVVWILWVSIQAGSRPGLVAALTAFLARGAVAAVLAAIPPYPAPTPDGLALFLAAGALLLLVGWLPGTAKKVWSKPRAEL